MVLLCPLSLASKCLEGLQKDPVLAPLFQKSSAEIDSLIRPWDSARLIMNVIALSQKREDNCEDDPEIEKIRLLLKRQYLNLLSVVPDDPKDTDLFFRAFLVPPTEFKKLKVKLRIHHPRTPMDIKRAFGGFAVLRGVPILGTDYTIIIEKLISRLCSGEKGGLNCGFWNPRSLFRVVTTKRPGIAAFIPELGTLVLSLSLLKSESLLNDFVLAHELSHVWILSEKREGRDVVKTFSSFSGWGLFQGYVVEPKVKYLGAWTDSLVNLSNGSPFSFLPDSAIANEDPHLDGFVTQRSFRESNKRIDVGEDVADHIAAYFIVPTRYCWKTQLLAPKKLAWLEKQFEKTLDLSCKANTTR